MSLDISIRNFKFSEREESVLRRYSNSDIFLEKAKQVVIYSTTLYSTTTTKMKEIILKTPIFVRYNHHKIMGKMVQVYGINHKQKLKRIILNHPPFIGYDHERVLQETTQVYGTKYRDLIITAIMIHPSFAGLNHERVLEQKLKLGKLLGITRKETILKMLKQPVTAGCSYHRDFAILDILKHLESEHITVTPNQVWNNYTKSPYVPNTNKLKMSTAKRLGILTEMPPLYETLKRIGFESERDYTSSKIEKILRATA